MATQIKGNSQNETIALLLASAQLLGHQESWIQSHNTPTGSDQDDYMYIMEWISQCFVLEKVGDVAAVASVLVPGTPAPPAAASASAPKSGTASAPTKMNFAAAAKSKAPVAAPPAAVPAKVKLLVTNNKGKNTTAQNTAFGKAFVKILNEKIQQDGTFYSGATNKANLTKAVDDLMRVVVEYGWPRVSSKLSKVKEAFPVAQRPTAVGKVLDLWQQKNLFVEKDFVEQVAATDAGGKKRTPKEILDIRIATLKSHNKKVMEVDPSAQTLNTTELKLALLRDMCNSCKYLLQAFDGVMKRNPAPPMPEGVSLDSFKRLRRRLWRVLRYSAGPQKFLIKGKSILKSRILLEHGNPDTIEFLDPEWVAKDPKLATLFSTAPPEITIAKDTFINWFKEEFTNTLPATNQKKKSATDSITNFCNNPRFNNGIKWRPSLHCEVTLLAYLYLTGTKIICNAIGVSKLNCFACSVYTTHLKTASPGIEYNMTGTSGKTHHQWLIPSSAVFSTKPALKTASDAGTQKVKADTKAEIRDFLNDSGRRNSVGSDSSTGSGGMDANEVYLLGP